jgi:hypothetical protein
MKVAIYCNVFFLVSLWSFTVFGQGTCPSENGSPNAGGQPYPYEQANPYGTAGGGLYNSNQHLGGYPSVGPLNTSGYPSIAPQAAPTASVARSARITVVSANESPSPRTISKLPAAKLSVVADDAPTAPIAVEVAAEEPTAIDSQIAGLVGTWKAVARQSDGELTTVELHLDNRGWAELTVPGSDGKPSTTKSRVNLENEELKLKGSDKVVSLGKLVEFNARQMVLERAEGQMTFVRL